jgi:formate hydrogenlyase subunit 3/multisubunit Na+/H+ antiporter MnhD subunit
MEQKGRTKLWHVIAALALGYFAAGTTYYFFPRIIAYPIGRMGGAYELVLALNMLVSLGVWIFVSVYCIRRWRRNPQ